MNEINAIGPVGESGFVNKPKSIAAPQDGASFKETLSKYINDVNEMQEKAGTSIKKMVAGEITDVHQVMTSVEQANTAFNMMMELRNKVMEAYQEIMRIRL